MNEPYEEVLSKLDGVVRLGDGKAKALCPCHDDHNPSLHVSIGDNGKPLIKCMACDAGFVEVIHAIGLTKDRVHRTHEKPKASKPKSRTHYPSAKMAIAALDNQGIGTRVGEWTYRDADGNAVAMVVRYNKENGNKEYRPITQDDSGWYIGAPDGLRLPYRLDEISSAETIYVHEGEKATDAGWSIGLPSTTSMNGAQSPGKTGWSFVKGKHIVIFADNDDAGRQYAAAVSKLCYAAGALSVKIINLPNIPEHGDIVEWIESHSDACEPDTMRAEIDAMVAAVQPEENKDDDACEFMTAEDLLDQYPDLERPVFDGLLRVGETMNLIATSKARKSWLVLAMGLSVVMGRPWLGQFLTRQGRVMIIDNELSRKTIAYRLRIVMQAMQITKADLAGRLCIKSLRGQLKDLRQLADEVSKIKPGYFDLVVLDAFYRLLPAGVDENSNSDITQLYNVIDNTMDKIGAACIVVHHSSKGNQSGKSVVDTGSGAGAMARAADTHVAMRQHEYDDVMVVESVARSWPPMKPFCIRLNHPLWEIDPLLDPGDLRQEKPRRKTEQPTGPSKDQLKAQKDLDAKIRVLEVYENRPAGETESKVSEAAGMNSRVFGPINEELKRSKFVTSCMVPKRGTEYPGNVITEAGIEHVRQLRQLRQNSSQSDMSGVSPTSALSLESTVCRSQTYPVDKQGNLSDFYGGKSV